MKEKWIEDLVGCYYVFGEHKNGTVDLCKSDTFDDLLCGIKVEHANTLITDRGKLVAALIMAINAHGDGAYDVFDKIRREIYKPANPTTDLLEGSKNDDNA